jgi:hypothetical protein
MTNIKKAKSDKTLDKDIRDLVVARLQSLPNNRKISIGSNGEFTREELVQDVREGSSIGNKIIEIQLNYLKSLKDGIFLSE